MSGGHRNLENCSDVAKDWRSPNLRTTNAALIGLALLAGLACTRSASEFAVLEAKALTIREGDTLEQVLSDLGDPSTRLEKSSPPGVAIFYEGPNEGRINLVFKDGRFAYGALESNGKFTRLPVAPRP